MTANTKRTRALSPLRALLYGAVAVGVIDFLYATVFVVFRGRPWYRPWQGVAYALLGPDALEGGYATAFLGICLHFTVATCIVAVYWIASRWIAVLRRKTLLWGFAFGVIAFFVMNLVVVPVTRIGYRPLEWTPFNIGGLLLHAFFLGPAAAYFAGRAEWGSGRAR